jgi:hypothetical protein
MLDRARANRVNQGIYLAESCSVQASSRSGVSATCRDALLFARREVGADRSLEALLNRLREEVQLPRGGEAYARVKLPKISQKFDEGCEDIGVPFAAHPVVECDFAWPDADAEIRNAGTTRPDATQDDVESADPPRGGKCAGIGVSVSKSSCSRSSSQTV